MIATIQDLAVLLTALVGVVGWFATYALSRRASRETLRREAALRHLEEQLGELYGPLAFLIIEGDRVFADLVADFGTSWAAGQRVLDETEVEKWLFWVDTYFFPRNEQIKDLLSTKTHLLEGDRVPHSFLRFVDHSQLMEDRSSSLASDGARERLYSRRRWPQDFSEEVLATFQTLKARHAELLGAQLPRLSLTPLAARRESWNFQPDAEARVDEWVEQYRGRQDRPSPPSS